MEKKKNDRFPISHLIGFLFSLAMTFGAIWIALESNLSSNAIMWIIGSLAVVQALLQLYMFMHMREGEDSSSVTINVYYGFFIAVVTILGTIWTMGFGNHDYHEHNSHNQEDVSLEEKADIEEIHGEHQ